MYTDSPHALLGAYRHLDAGGQVGERVSNRGGTMDHRYGADIQGGSRAISGRSKQSSIYPARCGLPSMFLCLFFLFWFVFNDRKETINTWRHKQKREDIELQYKRRYETSATSVEKTQVMQLKKGGGA